MISIETLLGTDSFTGSRITINANFQSILAEVNAIETNFGMSITSGNIDISSAIGGSLKAKTGAFNSIQLPSSGVPNITLTGSTGSIIGTTLSLGTSASIPTLTSNDLTMSSLGQSIFNGEATFTALVKISDGLAYNYVNIGTTNHHTVINDDRVILFTLGASSPGAFVLTPDPSLIDGHVITLVDTTSVATTLDTTYIMGTWGSITFDADGYKSCITLMWSVLNTKWIIIGSSNITFV